MNKTQFPMQGWGDRLKKNKREQRLKKKYGKTVRQNSHCIERKEKKKISENVNSNWKNRR